MGACGLTTTEKPSRATVSVSVASSSALNGAREIIMVARLSVAAKNRCSRGFTDSGVEQGRYR